LRSGTRAPVALALLYLALALHGLGAADVVGDDEAREVGVVQDVAAGHWLLPRFDETLLPDKPILFHWLAALPCAAAGFSEAAVRLPSAAAGAALVGWTAAFGGALFGPPGGLAAGALLATMPALFARARVARPDVLLAALLAAALGAAYAWWRDGRRRNAVAALVLLGAATFAKGPVAPALFVATLAGFLLWERNLRRLSGLLTLPGLVAFAVLGLGWYAVALAGWGDAFVREHFVGRYLANLTGGIGDVRPYASRSPAFHLLFYPKHLPLVALPWTPLAALAVWRGYRQDRLRDPRLRFLLCWTLAPVVVFAPAEYKLRHYLLPAVPALALLAAPAAVALWRSPRMSRGAAAACAALAAAAVGVVAWGLLGGTAHLARSDRETVEAALAVLPHGASGAAALAGFVTGVLLLPVARRSWAGVLAVVGAGLTGWMALGMPAVATAAARRDSLKPFALEAARRFPSPAPLVFAGPPIRAVVVYAGRPIPSLGRGVPLPAGAGVIATEADWTRLAAAGDVGPPLLRARGRIGNVRRDVVVLAEAAARAP